MIVVLKPDSKKQDIELVIKKIHDLGFTPHPITGIKRTIVGAIGDDRGKYRLEILQNLPCVEKLVPILQPYKLASSEFKKKKSVVRVKEAVFGMRHFGIIAGPCSVESERQIIETALLVKKSGAKMLRGGAYKPRTSPYSFQGLEKEGIQLLAKAREVSGLPFVTEVINPEHVKQVAEEADMLQIGARNVQNFSLLKEAGRSGRPVLLKRGMATTIQEFLMSAEYILSEGCKNVVLCERGIRTFETSTRFTLDISAIPVIHERSHLPIIVDPSHAAGSRVYVGSLVKAAVGAGADGIIVEVHPEPKRAVSDAAQTLDPKAFRALMKDIQILAKVLKRSL